MGDRLLAIGDGRWAIMQGLILCIIMPTATAAPIIAGKLGGSIQNLTTFTLLSNFLTALIVPALFPLINPSADIAFWSAAWQILCRVAPLLILPFVSAWGIRLCYEWWYKRRGEYRTFNYGRAGVFGLFFRWCGFLF